MPPVGGQITQPSQNSVSTPVLWILAIGVNQTQVLSLPELHFAAADCQDFVSALTTATQPLTRTHWSIHHDGSTSTPNLTVVQDSIAAIINQAQAQDSVLGYFSGHALLDPDTKQPFLCLADTDSQALRHTGLSLVGSLQQLRHCQAHRQLVILDACRSGSLSLQDVNSAPNPKSASASPAHQLTGILRQHASQTQGFYALLSCDQNQYSWERSDLGHGIFTHYLIQGLEGEAADTQGNITVSQLYRYVYYQTLKHIDKTNQQIELLNQQKRGRGEVELLPTYPAQTPKWIVEDIGEWVIGHIPRQAAKTQPRLALVVDGLSPNHTSLAISRILQSTGQFELEYWPQPRQTWSHVQTAIDKWFKAQLATASQHPPNNHNSPTRLLYLRGTLQTTTDGEDWLVLGNIRYSRSWLRQKLRQLSSFQQILILDCPGSDTLTDWIEDLHLGPEQSQCIITATTPREQTEQFSQALLSTLEAVAPAQGLPVAGWITHLQQALADTDIQLHTWLSGAQGIIEVIPEQRETSNTDADLKICPYMGLSAFTEQDADYFFGREQLTQTLINALRYQPFLALVGASGSGKSSLVQAGMMAQLRRGNQIPGSEQWWLGCFRPGSQPLVALHECLIHSPTQDIPEQALSLDELLQAGALGFVQWLRSRLEPMVVLIIDQFEELFTLTPETARQSFFNLLLGALEQAGDRFKLVITLRADFIAAGLEVPALAAQLRQSTVLVPPQLAIAEEERAIIQPAQKVGLTVEPELVEILLQELQDAAGGLPLLEFVLEQLWDHRQGGKLKLQAYQRQIGGIRGALERKAQAVYDNFTPEEKDCARWIFTSLAQLGEGTEDTRRRTRKADLMVPRYSTLVVERTLQALTTAKLIIVNATRELNLDQPDSSSLYGKSEVTTVEIAHEVLIRYWPTLQQWLEANRTRLRLQRQIEQLAAKWRLQGEPADDLLRGIRLEEAEEICSGGEISKVCQDFIQASAIAREIQRQQEHQAKEDGVKALNLIAEAHLNADRQLEALISSTKAGHKLQQLPTVSQHLRTETIQVLHHVCTNVQELNRLYGHEDVVTCVSISPNGELIVSGDLTGTIKLWQTTGTLLNTIAGHSEAVVNVAFSADGQQFVSASKNTTLKIWGIEGELTHLLTCPDAVNSLSLNTDRQIIAASDSSGHLSLWRWDGSQINLFQAHEDTAHRVAISPDTQYLASASADGSIKLWQLDGTLDNNWSGHDGLITSLCFSPDGQTLASAGADQTIKHWHLDGTLITALNGHSNSITAAIFHTERPVIVSSSFDSTIKIWGMDGTLHSTIAGHRETVSEITLSADNTLLASAGADRVIKLWYWQNPLHTVLKGHQGYINSLRFDAAGETLVSAGQDGSIRLWNPDGRQIHEYPAHEDLITAVNFSPDRQLIASTSFDKTVKLWHTNGSLSQIIRGHSGRVYGSAFSPSDDMIVSASADGTAKLWSTEGSLLVTLPHPGNEVVCVTFAQEGKTIVSGTSNGSLYFWQPDGTLVRVVKAHGNMILAFSLSPDGSKLATASQDRTIKVWDIDGEPLNALPEQSGPAYNVSFSPDGSSLAFASSSNVIQTWSLEGILTQSLICSQNPCVSVCFHPQCNLLAVGDTDGLIHLMSWPLNLNDLVTHGDNWLQDYYSANEVGEQPYSQSSQRVL
ncbi:caspase domain protein [Synechococcus sp. PCC 7335]|uniref:nSTAND1 domain-containing NTPase n=1 Tax=Synechococcus sp. (strain ATCC 29403 / PCC 7335) TaxID=91464 RepID=UPI00017EDD78|nr:caspase family protein [Synechococcus sp. PCC 7335]EDX83239.1 caspase domain protein [Synechococcus sp. PCC 7335]